MNNIMQITQNSTALPIDTTSTMANPMAAAADNTGSDRINPFIAAANPLLSLITQIKKSSQPSDLNQLREQIIAEIQLFEQKMLQLNYSQRLVMAARYCLCTSIDEAILSTDWGTQTVWVQHSLLSYFHQETWGGERFYLILEQMIKEPRRHFALIELIYLLLSLGFEGKFFDKDRVIREEIRNRVMQVIRSSSEKAVRTLSLNVKDTQSINHKQSKSKSLKWLGLSTAAVLLAVNLGFNIALSIQSHKTIQAYKKVGMESANTAYSQLINRSIVSQDKA